MNFVDVQPKSFLDYAWTTPSPPIATTKSSKTSRKQNRCCDQCRKGKRACDAAILEDTLLDNNGTSAGNPTVFHYSDVFGSLAPCANCEKTKKKCTFEWLRSQRVLQATPQTSTAPPAKKRRMQFSSSNSSSSLSDSSRQTEAPQKTNVPAKASGENVVPQRRLVELGVTFADFPGIPAFGTDQLPLLPFEDNPKDFIGVDSGRNDERAYLKKSSEPDDEHPLDWNSEQGSSLETSSFDMNGSSNGHPSETPKSSGTDDQNVLPPHNREVIRVSRKRRRRSCSSALTEVSTPIQAFSVANDFLSSANNAFLGENLLKIYHDSFENALSCWLTERTCPYGKTFDVSSRNDAGPDWNRIYHRVFKLDRLTLPIRGRHLTCSENQAASRALNLAIFSFATQWDQSSRRSKSRYPYRSDGSDIRSGEFGSGADIDGFSTDANFGRALQTSAWHEARAALHEAAEIESFRVVLAHIVFSMTQKPFDEPERLREGFVDSPITGDAHSAESEEKDVNECDDLLSKLTLTMDRDGPPVHLEQGLRLIHSLRSRMTVSGTRSKTSLQGSKLFKSSSNRLDETDRATVDLLFWLGVMFDTLSAAMHQRPLVVSDEDSDIYSNGPKPTATQSRSINVSTERDHASEHNKGGLWDDHLFDRQRIELQGNAVRWPCSYEQAASLLCDAAPVKVLLFRKVTRIQTLLSRKAHRGKIEKAVKGALDVYDHWETLYASFVEDCIRNHDCLPARIQSWYICLGGHWHLATLLLADLIEIIDDSELGEKARRDERATCGFITQFRKRNCNGLSDLARCACPRENASFPESRDFHFAMNEGAILTEPWTAVLIRGFAKAGVILLEAEEQEFLESGYTVSQGDAFRRADDCVKALWYLGRKSDMARSAAKILGEALRERRKGAEDRIEDMSSFLEAGLWEGFGEMGAAFGTDCL